MEDGLFQLLFILFFIIAAIFDAVARSRAKRRRMEEMDGAEGEEGAPAGADPEAASRRRAEREREHRERIQARRKAPDGSGGEAGTGAGDVRAGTEPERETADSMVPEDFWAILTGQPSRGPDTASGRDEPEPRTEREWEPDRGEEMGAGSPDPGVGRRSDPDPPREDRIPVPIASDRWGMGSGQGQPRPLPETPAETRRSSRWMEGVEGRDDSSRWTEGGTEGVHEQEERVYRLPPEPWGALEDISSGEITDGRGRVQSSAAAVGPDAVPVRRGAGRGTYTRLLETGDIRDLRKAIVIREVLGTPVGFREEETQRDIW